MAQNHLLVTNSISLIFPQKNTKKTEKSIKNLKQPWKLKLKDSLMPES